MRTQIRRDSRRIASLHENSAGPCEPTYEAFASAQVADDTATRDALHHVLAVPGNEMAVVDDVSLTLAELQTCQPNRTESSDLKKLTSFRIMAPILMIQQIPTPLILYTNSPSPENIALLKLWLL